MRAAVFAGMLALAGCAGMGSNYEVLGIEKPDRGYYTYRMTFARLNTDRSDSIIYYKLSENQGKLKACGYVVGASGTNVWDIRQGNNWFAQATLFVEGNPVGSSGFIKYKTPRTDHYDTDALCVLFNTAWDSNFALHRIQIKGDSVRGFF